MRFFDVLNFFVAMIGNFKVILTSCLLSCSVFAQVPAQIVDFQKDFGKAVLAADATYAATTNALPRTYLASLAQMEKKYQSDGDLAGLLAVKNEIKRFKTAIAEEPDPFESVPEMPQDAFVKSPEDLRKLQEEYVAGFAKALKTQKESISAAAGRLKDRIEEFQKDMVKAGKIDEAVAIRDLSQEINRDIDSGRYSNFISMLSASDKSPVTVQGRQSETKTASRNTASQKSSWHKWKYVGSYPFSKELLKFRHPDVPDTMAVSYDSERGRLMFSGICPIPSFQCGPDFCTSFGKAVEWSVSSRDLLDDVDLIVKSKSTTISLKNGPQLQLAVFVNGRRLKMLNVPLTYPEIKLEILRNPNDPSDFIFRSRKKHTIEARDAKAIDWITFASERFSLNSDTPVNIVLGVSYCNMGEKCDTVVEFQ